MDEILKEGEILEPVNRYSIIVNPDLYRYTSDSARLANSVNAASSDKIADLCSGGGIIPLIIASQRNFARIDCVELQTALADAAERSFKLNGLQNKITVYNNDINDFLTSERKGAYDIVTCNPPYYPVGAGDMRRNDSAAIARYEITAKLADIVRICAQLLKYGGKAYMVHKTDRLSEVLCALTANNLEPKELTLFGANIEKPDSFIVIAKKGAKSGIKVKTEKI